jgi:hypothetical protein
MSTPRAKSCVRRTSPEVDRQTPWLTHCLAQLLDPETRKLYDAVPFGMLLFDKYEAERMKREQMAQEREMMMELASPW